VIVEAVREDVWGGSFDLEYGKRDRTQCGVCGRVYELVVLADFGEYESSANPLPIHFKLLEGAIEADHADNHEALIYRTNGLRVWEPLRGSPLDRSRIN